MRIIKLLLICFLTLSMLYVATGNYKTPANESIEPNNLPDHLNWTNGDYIGNGYTSQVFDGKDAVSIISVENNGENKSITLRTSNDFVDWTAYNINDIDKNITEISVLDRSPFDFEFPVVIETYDNGSYNLELLQLNFLFPYMTTKAILQDAFNPVLFSGPDNEPYMAYLDNSSTGSNPALVYRNIFNYTLSPIKEIQSIVTPSRIDVLYNDQYDEWYTMFHDSISGDLQIKKSNDGTSWSDSYYDSDFTAHSLLMVDDLTAAVILSDPELFGIMDNSGWTIPKSISDNNINGVSEPSVFYLGEDVWIVSYSDGSEIYFSVTNNYENLLNTSTTISTPSNQTSGPFSTSNPDPGGDYVGLGLIIFIGVVLGVIILSRVDSTPAKEKKTYTEKKSIPREGKTGSKVVDTEFDSSRYSDPNDVPMINIPELGRQVRQCCYQTARLNEKYCWCGRAIPHDLQNLFE